MKLYKIKQDGFQIGGASGKKKAIETLKKILTFEGITYAYWEKFQAGVLKVKTNDHDFTIEESL